LTLAWDARATLGEGPLWDDRERVLYWVDVEGHTLYTLGAERRQVELAGRVSSVALREGGGLLVAHDCRVSLLEDDVLVPFATLPDGPPTNDGAVDPRGRYLVGTNGDDAALYRVDADAAVTQLLGGVRISNGIDWSDDGRTMFYVDSLAHGVDAFDYDLDAGTISNRRQITAVDPDLGVPDGLTVDADGAVWVAIWGGSRVLRLAPDGELLDELHVPVRQPSSVMFGGIGLTMLYVTSAREGLDDPAPEDGGLFAFDVGVRGRSQPRFAR
jgi:sugar lactone lactonase YvrE